MKIVLFMYVSGDARKTEDNPQGLGCYLVMTGRGCDDIFRILDSRNYTFGDMFRRCERRYGLDNCHFTRLDIAIDDKNEKPFFTIEPVSYTHLDVYKRQVLYRALVFSNLLTVYQKQYIGKLSAFCGAVSASCAAGAGSTR